MSVNQTQSCTLNRVVLFVILYHVICLLAKSILTADLELLSEGFLLMLFLMHCKTPLIRQLRLIDFVLV